jgi:hypothetical protein
MTQKILPFNFMLNKTPVKNLLDATVELLKSITNWSFLIGPQMKMLSAHLGPHSPLEARRSEKPCAETTGKIIVWGNCELVACGSVRSDRLEMRDSMARKER